MEEAASVSDIEWCIARDLRVGDVVMGSPRHPSEHFTIVLANERNVPEHLYGHIRTLCFFDMHESRSEYKKIWSVTDRDDIGYIRMRR